MALTSLEGYEFLQTTLKADTVLQAAMGGEVRAFQRNHGEGTVTYPYILIRFVVGIPLMVLGARDVWTVATYDVFVVNKSNSTGEMKTIVNRVDTVLNRASGLTSGGQVFFCSKAENMSEIATTDPWSPGGGTRIQNLGRSWSLILKAG